MPLSPCGGLALGLYSIWQSATASATSPTFGEFCKQSSSAVRVCRAYICRADGSFEGANRVSRGRMVAERIELSDIGRRCGPNQIKTLVSPFLGVPDVAMLAQGAPPSTVYPIKSISLELTSGETLKIDAPAEVEAAQSYLYARSGYVPLQMWCKYAQRSARPPAPPHSRAACALSHARRSAPLHPRLPQRIFPQASPATWRRGGDAARR